MTIGRGKSRIPAIKVIGRRRSARPIVTSRGHLKVVWVKSGGNYTRHGNGREEVEWWVLECNCSSCEMGDDEESILLTYYWGNSKLLS